MQTNQQIKIIYEAGNYTATLTHKDNVIIADGSSLDEVVKDLEKGLQLHSQASQETIHVDIQIASIHFVYTPSHASNL